MTTHQGLETRVVLQRRNWRLPGELLAVSLLLLGGGIYAWPLYLLALPVAIAALTLVLRNSYPRINVVTLRASLDGLSLDDAPAVPLEAITEVRRLGDTPAGTTVELAFAAPPARAPLAMQLTVKDADDLLALIGPRRAAFPIMLSLRLRFLVPFALVLGAMGYFAGGIGFLLVMAYGLNLAGLVAVPFTLLAGLIHGRAVIGVDGFTVRWGTRERFVPYSDVVGVTERLRITSKSSVDVRVALKNGRTIELRGVDAESKAMASAIGAAREAVRERAQTSVDAATAVERQGRSPHAWLAGVDAAVHGGYRVAGMDADKLASLVLNPAAARDARVGAATALLRIGTDDGRARVRVAAEGCAESDLRDVLHALAEAEDDEAVASALSRVAR